MLYSRISLNLSISSWFRLTQRRSSKFSSLSFLTSLVAIPRSRTVFSSTFKFLRLIASKMSSWSTDPLNCGNASNRRRMFFSKSARSPPAASHSGVSLQTQTGEFIVELRECFRSILLCRLFVFVLGLF